MFHFIVRPRGLVVSTCASRAGGPEFNSRMSVLGLDVSVHVSL